MPENEVVEFCIGVAIMVSALLIMVYLAVVAILEDWGGK
jgi:hypothetical protein